jgi:hypothetical protein
MKDIVPIIIIIALVTFTNFLDKSEPSDKVAVKSATEHTNTTTQSTIVSAKSDYSKRVSISSGNARSAYQSYLEYITLTNRSKQAMDITGWKLKSDLENRTYYINGSLQKVPGQIAYVPTGTKFISPTGASVMQDIVLNPGEKAIITTGSIGSRLPYQIVSFKENICSGYLENMPEYNFTPALSRQCPKPANEAGLENLDPDCRDFVEGLSSCKVPDFTPKNKRGGTCPSCVNKVTLSSMCYAYVKEHFSYKGCIANHKNDTNFELKTWRVFLGQKSEMWAKKDEVISVFDQLNKLVTSLSYK